MEKRILSIIYSVYLLIIIILIMNLVLAIDINGIITGKLSSQPMNVSILVIIPVSDLIIISPENETYLTNESLLLNFSVNNSNSIWYNIDNQLNITINSSRYFNTSQGSHKIYLYADDLLGNLLSRNVSFSINSTKFIIIYEEYKSSAKGNSTDFIKYSFEDIQNLGNVMLENTNFGKINFKQAINLTDDENYNDNTLDIDANTNISFNRIELNSTALPNFNKPANLSLYNLSFFNPRILINGVVCSSCIKENYSGGTLKFNVSGFYGYSIFSAEETPSEITAPGGGGGAEVCSPSWVCSNWSECINNIRTRKCEDEKKCNSDSGKPYEIESCITPKNDTNITIPEGIEKPRPPVDILKKPKKPGELPVADWNCGEWSKCHIVYKLDDLIEKNIIFKGEQTRFCIDKNNNYFSKLERRECETKMPITVKKVSKDYVEVYGEDEKLISTINFENKNKPERKLNIKMIFDEPKYPSYCYNGVKDYDETGLDCGGSCIICHEIARKSWLGRWLIIILLLILFFIAVDVILLLLIRYHRMIEELEHIALKSFKKEL